VSKQGAVLVLGAGNSLRQNIKIGKNVQEAEAVGDFFSDNFEEVVTIDMDPGCKPTYVWDLQEFPWPVNKEHFDAVHAYEVLEHLSIPEGKFDEVHAYEVLCNLGGVGNWKFFFQLWKEIWNCLKPGGLVCASTPWWESVWAWQDPGHRRVYSPHLLTYLSQEEYKKQVGKTAMTDYRGVWHPPFNFHLVFTSQRGEDPKTAGFNFVLQKHYYKEGE
jgi:SAM-dependent methyltransferase